MYCWQKCVWPLYVDAVAFSQIQEGRYLKWDHTGPDPRQVRFPISGHAMTLNELLPPPPPDRHTFTVEVQSEYVRSSHGYDKWRRCTSDFIGGERASRLGFGFPLQPASGGAVHGSEARFGHRP
jgi:hypothetical protein